MFPSRLTQRIHYLWDRALLALSALAPISAVFGVSLYDTNAWVSVILVASSLLAALGAIWLVKKNSGTNIIDMKIDSVRDAGPEAAAYLTSFILPFLMASNLSVSSWIALGLFTFIYVVVIMNTGAIAVNPVLYLMGYRIWRVESDERSLDEVVIVSKHRPRAGSHFKVSEGVGTYVEHQSTGSGNG